MLYQLNVAVIVLSNWIRELGGERLNLKRDWSGKRDSNSRPLPWQARIMLYQLNVAVTVWRNWIRELGGREIEFEERLERKTRLELAIPALASADHALPTECGSDCMEKLDS
ncbi:hypothetical protein [Aeromonas dhakensis]|uniref:hypothetical protein n=1 Tax=Aeromonas dhakensis TaxID=196024 RepID=UPI001178B9FC|nr:hypothetical protein [Aeromonas dhakensis]